MKHLNEYVEENQTAIFNKYGVFFAFSNKQFDEAKKEGVKYVSMKIGMIWPEKNVENFINELDACYKAGIKKDIEENTVRNIIVRELYNHESFYTCDINPVVKKLSVYDISKKEIKAVYSAEYSHAIEICA